MKKHLFAYMIFLLVVLCAAEPVSAADMETFDNSVVNAKTHADSPAGWIPAAADMVKISEAASVGANPYGLKYYGDPANNQLIVRTLSKSANYNGAYSPYTPTTSGSNYSIYGDKNSLSAWVTTGNGMTGFIDDRALTVGTVVKGLERGLGMPDRGNHDAIFEMAVTVGNTANPYLLRPSRNPDPTVFSTNPAAYGTNPTAYGTDKFPADASAAGIGTGAAADNVYANYKTAYATWAAQSHDPSGSSKFPWTELGYTYYWGQAANVPTNLSEVQGMSELIMLGGTGNSNTTKTPSGTDESGKVVVVGIYATQSYLYTKNNGTSLSSDAAAQYGNGFASFNVTGACDTLWAGAAFQVRAYEHMNAVSPNTITVGAGGSISSGQGILVGSLNYTVTNAGIITANADTKKFNVPGSENIALLFRGDTHSAPYVGAVKNTLINSGTITAPGANGTAVASWAGDTNINNTGTITGTGTGYAIKTASGNDVVHIYGGAVTGRVDLGTGADVLDVASGSNATFTFTLNADAPTAVQIKSQTVSIADNTTVFVKASGTSNIKNNEQFLIADATTLTVDPTKLSIINDPSLPMIHFSAGKSGNQLLLTVLRDGSYYGQHSGNASLGAVLDALTNTATGDMSTVLATLDNSGYAGNARKFEPSMDRGVVQAGYGTNGQFTQNVVSRIDQILASRTDGTGMTGISTGDEAARVGVWAQGFGTYLHQGQRGTNSGYDGQVWGVSFGFDRFVYDHFIAGFSGGYAHTRIPTSNAGAGMDADSYQASLYGSLARSAYYIDGILSAAYNAYDASRHILFGGMNRTAKSIYNGHQYSGYVEGGYTFKTRGFLLTPLASAQYMRLQVNDYTETGADSLNLKVDSQKYNLFQSGLGAKLSYPFMRAGVRINPEVYAKWLYDFIGDRQQATSTFSGGGASFATTGFDPPKSSYNLGAKLMLVTKHNVTLSLNYNFEMKEDFYSHSGFVNARYEF